MELVYKELSYKIVGSIFNIYNFLGYGYREKDYQKALAADFDARGIKYVRELYSNLKYLDKVIAGYYLDFLVNDQIVVELKVANGIYKQHINQVLQYLKNNKKELGIIAVITPTGVFTKRLINQKSALSA